MNFIDFPAFPISVIKANALDMENILVTYACNMLMLQIRNEKPSTVCSHEDIIKSFVLLDEFMSLNRRRVSPTKLNIK